MSRRIRYMASTVHSGRDQWTPTPVTHRERSIRGERFTSSEQSRTAAWAALWGVVLFTLVCLLVIANGVRP